MDSHESYDPSRCPAWLPRLLRGRYFTSCPRHAGSSRAERNYFCVPCSGESICSTCITEQHSAKPSHHSGSCEDQHNILQIRRSSYHECVRINEVAKILDLSHIQVYIINSAKIVFLNGRPQARPVKGAPFYCETCERMLLDASRFCSLGCKLAAVPKDSTLSFVPRFAPSNGGHGAGMSGVYNAHKRGASAAAPQRANASNAGAAAASAGGNADTWREDKGNSNSSSAWVQKARTVGKKRGTPEASPPGSLLDASMEYDNIGDTFADSDSGSLRADDDDRDGSFVWSRSGFGGGKRVRVEKHRESPSRNIHMAKFPPLVPISSPYDYPDGSPTSPQRLEFSPPSTPSLTGTRRRKGVPQRSPFV